MVVLVARSDDSRIVESVMAGACGCLIKPVPKERLEWAVSEAAAGGIVLCREAQAALAAYVQRLGTTRSSAGLTSREHEVIMGVTSGLSYKETAQRLQIAPCTVHTLLSRAYKKLGASSKAQARGKLLPP
jgi:DNA-binding NarL/FixJ family response regulator